MDKEKALRRLGYTVKWLEAGIITENLLFEQFNEIKVSEDQNAEHYRCGAFAYYLNQKSSLCEEEISSILNLQDYKPGHDDLQSDRIIRLIESGLLNKKQLIKLAEFSLVNKAPVNKRYLRAVLISEIKELGIEKVFDKIAKSTDTAIHELILSRDDLEKNHVKWLVEFGGNKSIRNRAKQMLRSRRFK